jgi:hypothetical protein
MNNAMSSNIPNTNPYSPHSIQPGVAWNERDNDHDRPP